jgi:hypothetical protein
VGGGVQLGSLGTAVTNRAIVPAPGDYDYGEIGGMIGRGNRSTRRKPAPVSLCPSQAPHAALTRTRAAAVGSQRLSTWATARPTSKGKGLILLRHDYFQYVQFRIIAAGPRQQSHFWFRGRNSWPYFSYSQLWESCGSLSERIGRVNYCWSRQQGHSGCSPRGIHAHISLPHGSGNRETSRKDQTCGPFYIYHIDRLSNNFLSAIKCLTAIQW